MRNPVLPFQMKPSKFELQFPSMKPRNNIFLRRHDRDSRSFEIFCIARQKNIAP